MLDKLGSSLRSTLEKIKNAMFVDEKLINEIMKEIQRALLQADINVKLVIFFVFSLSFFPLQYHRLHLFSFEDQHYTLL